MTGEQFAWTFAMNEGGKLIQANQIVLPVDEEVQFKVHSKDVLHDFWVPEWRLKVDAVPGITTDYKLTPIKTGRFQVVCAELCGLGHAFMRQFIQRRHAGRLRGLDRDSDGPAPGAAPAAGGGGAAAQADGKQLFTAGNQADRRDGVRRLPHALGGRHDGADRPEPRQGAQGLGRGAHPRGDHQPRQGDRQGLRGEHHAPELPADPERRASSTRWSKYLEESVNG